MGTRLDLPARPEDVAEVRRLAAEAEAEAARKRTEYGRRLQERKRAEIDVRKRERGCADCGLAGTAVPASAFYFWHRPGERRDFYVSQGVNYSFEKLQAEMDKCDVVCATCRAVRLAERAVVLETAAVPAVVPVLGKSGPPPAAVSLAFITSGAVPPGRTVPSPGSGVPLW